MSYIALFSADAKEGFDVYNFGYVVSRFFKILVVLEKQTDCSGGGGSKRPFKKSADIKSER